MQSFAHAYDGHVACRCGRCGGRAPTGTWRRSERGGQRPCPPGTHTQRPEAPRPFAQRTSSMGLRIDVTNVADALELLEGPAHR